MDNRIVADGESNLRQSPEYQARLRSLRESVLDRYAPELAAAGWFRRGVLLWRRESEWRAVRKKEEPSLATLYGHRN